MSEQMMQRKKERERDENVKFTWDLTIDMYNVFYIFIAHNLYRIFFISCRLCYPGGAKNS